MSRYEIEVKSLLGTLAAAERLKESMRELDPATSCVSTNTQLNHYFEGGDMEELYRIATPLFRETEQKKLRHIIDAGRDFSIRTRQKNDTVLLVLKASLDEGTSANTVSRLEFEEKVSITLDQLDDMLREAGFSYQAKWSREREEYTYKGITVCLDKNAGYGYLAEFEKMTDDEAGVGKVRDEIRTLMGELGVTELPQERLERMFAHYNQHWMEYYGTNKTFTIE